MDSPWIFPCFFLWFPIFSYGSPTDCPIETSTTRSGMSHVFPWLSVVPAPSMISGEKYLGTARRV